MFETELFNDFDKKMEMKREEKRKEIKEGIKKGTNYAMKEAENVREIKVTVLVGKDLKTEIKQDF